MPANRSAATRSSSTCARRRGFVTSSALLLTLAGHSRLHAQGQPPPPVQWFPAADATANPGWQGLLDRATLTIGRYWLASGAVDPQSPHDRDEVYCVLRGRAKFTAGGETRSVGPGDAVFVAAEAPHRFHDIEQDLEVMVFFSAATPSTGGMAAGPTPTEQTPYPETSPRGNTRVFYWFGPDSAGQVAIDHGRPRWNPSYEKFLQQTSGRRWRFGENFWTTLDTNMPLRLGEVEVPVGLHYVAMQHDQEHGLALVLLDPTEIRRQRLDAYEAPKTKGGLLVPLRSRDAATVANRLHVELTVDRAHPDTGELVVRFGPHELFAPLRMTPHR